MASFAPPSEIQTPNDEDNRARPIAPNRATADIFSGLSEGVRTGLAAADQGIKHELYNTVGDALEVTNAQFHRSVPDALAGGGAGGGPVSGPSNPEIEKARTDIDRMTIARNQGMLDDAHYWAKIQVQAKMLRARYPDWNEEIDQMFNEQTGSHTLQGKLSAAIERQDADRASKVDPEQKFIQEAYKTHASEIEKVMPGEGARFFHRPTDQQWKILSGVMQVDGQKKINEAKKVDLETQEQQDKADNTQTVSVLSDGLRNIVQSHLFGLGATSGSDMVSIIKGMSQPGVNATPEQLDQARQLALQQKTSILEDFLKERNSNKAYSKLSDADFKKVADEAIKPFEDFEKILDTGKEGISLATRALADYNQGIQQGSLSLMKSSENVRGFVLADKMGGSTLAQLYSTHIGEERMTSIGISLATGGAAGLMSGADDINAQAKRLNEDTKLSKSDKQQGYTGALDKAVAFMSDPRTDPRTIQTFVTKNMTNKGQGMNDAWAGMGPEGKNNLFNKLTSDDFVKAVIKAGNNTTADYRDWMKDKFISLPGVKGAADEITESNKSNNPFNVRYKFNPTFGKFEVIPPTATGSTGASPMWRQEATQAAEQKIASFNKSFQHLSEFMKKTGNYPDGLDRVFEEMKMNGATDPSGIEYLMKNAKRSAGQAAPPPETEDEKAKRILGSKMDSTESVGNVLPEGAIKANDGNHYVPDPNRPGRYMRVDHD